MIDSPEAPVIKGVRYGLLDATSPGGAESLATLYAEVFPHADIANADYIRWQYADIPTGSMIAVGREEDSGKLIASSAMVRYDLSRRGETIPLWLMMNSSSIPGGPMRVWKEEGALCTPFIKCTRVVAQESVDAGGPAVVAMPNDAAEPAYRDHLKYTHIGSLGILVRPIDPAALLMSMKGDRWWLGLARAPGRIFAKLAFRGRHLQSDIELRRIERFDDRFDEFERRTSSRFSLVKRRGSDLLNWRFFECPNRSYCVYEAVRGGDLKGAIVLRNEKKGDVEGPKVETAVIADLIGDPTNDGLRTLEGLIGSALRAHLKEQPAAAVVSSLPTASPYWRALRANGLLDGAKLIKRRMPFYGHPATLESLPTFSQADWTFTLGDLDVI